MGDLGKPDVAVRTIHGGITVTCDTYTVKNGKWKKNDVAYASTPTKPEDGPVFRSLFERTNFVWWEILAKHCEAGCPDEGEYIDEHGD